MRRGSTAKTTVEVNGVQLTERERALLHALANGHESNKAAGRVLGVSASTTNEYLRSIFRKLGIRSRVAAAVWAVRQGIA